MKIGIAGAGMIVKEFLGFVHEIEALELEAICATPRNVENLKQLCTQYQIPNWYVDYDEMLGNDQVETVYVAAPNSLHFELCQRAIIAGKHVICEKPFTSNEKEAKELVDMAREKGIFLLDAVSTRYLPNLHAVKEHLAELGELRMAIANYCQYSSRYDAFKRGEVMPAFDPAMSGGALMDLNIYNINFMVSLFGRPQQVDYQANVQKGIDTSGILTLDYGSFKCACIAAKDCGAPVFASIQGEQGCLRIPFAVSELTSFTIQKNGEKEQEPINNNGDKHRMYHEFCEFVRIITENDYDTANQMMEITCVTMEILTMARKQAGIVFLADAKV